MDETIGNAENTEQLLPTHAEINGDCDQTIQCDGNPRYRSANGACNNLQKPALGTSFRAQARFLDPVYADGIAIHYFPRSRYHLFAL